MGENLGTINLAAVAHRIQYKIDENHSHKYAEIEKKITQHSYELRVFLDPLLTNLKRESLSQDTHHDLSQYEDEIHRLHTLYQENRAEFESKHPEAKEYLKKIEAEAPLLSDPSKVSTADLRKIISIADEVKTSHKDGLETMAAFLMYDGQIYVTILNMLKNTQEHALRGMRTFTDNQKPR